jgi:hypothetical protein
MTGPRAWTRHDNLPIGYGETDCVNVNECVTKNAYSSDPQAGPTSFSRLSPTLQFRDFTCPSTTLCVAVGIGENNDLAIAIGTGVT